jgi:6,7-dimethyl-8-ribityllumazine synthase
VTRDIDDSSENVLSEWSRKVSEEEAARRDEGAQSPYDADAEPAAVPAPEGPEAAWGAAGPDLASAEAVEEQAEELPVEEPPEAGAEGALEEPAEQQPVEEEPGPMLLEISHEHAVGELEIPDGYAVLEGEATGARRAVGVVVSRFNGAVTSRLLDRALEELNAAGVAREAITVMVVPGAFELPLAATALAKTRRFASVVALGCVIRGDTPHFDYVAGEAASGLQLAALETGVPVSFGVLTLDRIEQADPRIEKGAEAVRTALEMADVFSHLRAAASR